MKYTTKTKNYLVSSILRCIAGSQIISNSKDYSKKELEQNSYNIKDGDAVIIIDGFIIFIENLNKDEFLNSIYPMGLPQNRELYVPSMG